MGIPMGGMDMPMEGIAMGGIPMDAICCIHICCIVGCHMGLHSIGVCSMQVKCHSLSVM